MSKSPNNAVLDAVLRKEAGALRRAIEAGSNIDQPDREGRTPLSNAVGDGEVEIVKILLRAGANVDASDSQGITPLHFAAQRHSAEITNLLLSSGAKVDSRDSFGNTPLFRAVFESRGLAQVVSALLNAGADQYAKNNSGVSPRDLAASIANFDVLSLLSGK